MIGLRQAPLNFFSKIFFLYLWSSTLFAYPQFIGFGYKNCITCHYNPYGNGPLKDYGRALSGTLISDRVLYPKSYSEEEIGQNSGFLYRKPFNSWLRPSLFYRGLWLDRDIGGNANESEWINMQMAGNLVFKFGEKDKFYGSFTLAYIPTPEALKGKDVENWQLPESYLAYRPIDKFGVYLGIMDVTYGIRIPDHIAFSRSSLGLGQRDQTFGLLFHYVTDNFEGALQGFMGNLSQDKDLRQKGGSTILEYAFNDYLKPGVSLYLSKNDYLEKFLASFHTKIGYPKGSATLFEIGTRKDEALQIQSENKLYYLLWQNHLQLKRGLFGLFSIEGLIPNEDKDLKVLKYNLGLQYFLIQGVEFRFDLFNIKTLGEDAPLQDTWDFTGQIHLWF